MSTISNKLLKPVLVANQATAQSKPQSVAKSADYFIASQDEVNSPAKQGLWEKAIESNNIDRIKTALKQGIRPVDLTSRVTIKNKNGNQIDMPLIAVLLEENQNNFGQDYVYFKLADKLLKQGASLPQPHKKRSDFNSTAHYFSYLSQNSRDLYIALRSNPEIIHEQDEKDGLTLAHSAATIGSVLNPNEASLIHDLLFKMPGLNLNIKDKSGNTPVHVAALYCGDRVSGEYTFPRYIKQAKKLGFDFSTLGQGGQAILHIAARNSYGPSIFGSRNSIATLLALVPDIDVNVFSNSGSTALFYTIDFMHFAEADCLLEAGANPRLCGVVERDPLKMLNHHIDYFERLKDAYYDPEIRVELQLEDIEENVDEERIELIQFQLHRLEQLKLKILASPDYN